MKNLLSLLLLMFVIGSKTIAQTQKNELINQKKINQKLLERKVFDLINAKRDSLAFNYFRNDSILYKAAQHHAKYIAHKDINIHLEDNIVFATPEKRVKYYKGTHQNILELVELIKIDQPTSLYQSDRSVKINTYEELANFYIENAYRKKVLEEAIFNKDLFSSAISFEFNSSNKTLYVVQLFSSKPFQYPIDIAHKQHKKTFYPSKKANIENAYAINPVKDRSCTKCLSRWDKIPVHVGYGLVSENGKIYFYFDDAKYFDKLFYDGDEAIAVDVVHADQYYCNEPNILHNSDVHHGVLFPPMDKKQILKNNQSTDTKKIKTFIGINPYGSNYELSLLLLKNNSLCDYNINIPKINHEINTFETSFFEDTTLNSTLTNNKTLKFKIPYQKGKATFNIADIQPFFDSLELNKFNIKSMTVMSFTSIEGSAEINKSLQTQRAQSIKNIIQSFQLDSIKSVVRSIENWNEFYIAIKNTPYSWLGRLNKNQIKEKLLSDTLCQSLEPYFAKQRKAFIVLKVEEKVNLVDNNNLINLLITAISKENYQDALKIQANIFKSIDQKLLSWDNYKTINIPEKREASMLLNNEILYAIKNNLIPLDDAYVQLSTIANIIDPGNVFIRYNLCQFEMEAMKSSSLKIKSNSILLKNIKSLFNTAIDQKDVNKLYLNYYILNAENYASEEKYRYRDQAVSVVYKYKSTIDMTENDTYYLAQFLSKHGMKDESIELLKPLVDVGNYSEDMLFFYIGLAFHQYDLIKENNIPQLMIQAKELNPNRFCTLFGEEKVSFQLFHQEELKSLYCESCQPIYNNEGILSDK